MNIKKLHDGWSMRIAGEAEFVPAKVPGSVYNDLLLNNKMEDPYWRANENEALKIMDNDFEYKTNFSVPEEILNSDKVLLRFEGLDTIGKVLLNGICLGDVNNMHRTWEFDVKKLVNDESNELAVEFFSPNKYIKEENEKVFADGVSDCMAGFPHIRKGYSMMGWDWGPRLPDAGIWREVSLLGINTARIDSVYVTQVHEENQVKLNIEVSVDKAVLDYEAQYVVTIVSPQGEVKVYDNSPKTVSIENPKLWWPNGYGEQNLYGIKVTLVKNEKVLDVWDKKIGLRTLTVKREEDEYGESFKQVVNGVAYFAMGADYIPEDNILSRINKDRTRKLLKDCIAVNFNSIRVWGGGYYPEDFFFELCDELGLVVWQDFMYACAQCPLTPEFIDTIKKETIDNVKRIRHHASLGLWCGNNEMESFANDGLWYTKPIHKADYIRLFEYIIPEILKEYDPNTFYWPSSPSSGGAFDEPNSSNRGDTHYWDVWHGNKPFTEYRKFHFRYLSEFGFQSFPCLKTVESFTLLEDRNIFSYVMEKHQRNNVANGKIINYMQQTYLYPTDFDTLLYASQMLQAEAIKYGVEHFRRYRGRCMGAIYWQLNDCWPVASWASIDYFGRWKALHYFAKRFFAPLMLSCCEESTLTQNTNVNAESFALEKSIQLCIANETMSEEQVTVSWALRNNDGTVVETKFYEVRVKALSSEWLEKVSFDDADPYSQYVSYDMYKNGERISGGTVLFAAPKYFKFLDPKLSVEVKGDEVIIKAEKFAKGIEIYSLDADMLLSDNYFDLNSGEARVKLLQGEAKNLKVRSVYDIK
ncbi:glycoside hydrolase family 2 protein [Clostridium sp. 19966]|uniref:beta-mannosidase n=1 Tax=Clostridium sp. 19966 TaxID=2768166 RepID=UPI0028E05FAA|nr:sugar-binding domain-containing protein [Clostridium sp. 19966]MDT8716216.1 glycoside hydrolase family 2 protein [Clostridium sp. 19966]